MKMANMRKWMWENMHTPIDTIIKELNPKLRGHYQYYGITDNTRCIKSFHYETIKTLLKVLRRRSQKDKTTWERLNKQLAYNPILTPKIYVNIYA